MAELSKALYDIGPVVLRPPPVHFEDDIGGTGTCAVCTGRGTMTSRRKCGLVVHMACAPPTLPGRDIVCPRCEAMHTEDIEDGRVDGTMSRHCDIRSKLYKKTSQSASVVAQDGSAAASSDASAPVIAPLDGAIAKERATFARKKKAQLEDRKTRANMQIALQRIVLGVETRVTRIGALWSDDQQLTTQ